jgi:hypothetical protein
VRAAVAAAAAAADVPAREYCYSVPAAHAPGKPACCLLGVWVEGFAVRG